MVGEDRYLHDISIISAMINNNIIWINNYLDIWEQDDII